jgi:hypothetical protein
MSLSYELKLLTVSFQLFEESFDFDRGGFRRRSSGLVKTRQADLDHRCQHVLHLSYWIYTLY